MSLDFKLHYDRLREGDPSKPEAAVTSQESTFYDGPSHVRTLCLVWPDGKRQFLNYAYLIGGIFTLEEERNEIVLNFSAYIVTIRGYGLEALFGSLVDQLSKQIVQTEQRYVSTSSSAIAEISVQLIL